MVIRRHLWNVMCLVLCIPLFGATNQVLTEKLPQDTGKLSPRDLCQSGVRLLQANKIEEAVTVFQQAIKAFPYYGPAYNLLGVCYSRMGKTELAHQAFLEAVHFDPQLPEAHNSLGASYVALGKLDQAADQFEKSAVLNP